MAARSRTLLDITGPTDAPCGSILDVAGIGVGHHQRTGRGWRTGTTVVACAGGATPGVDVRGGGPGTRETDALRPGNLVDTVHAVCLTGGSAYGLAAVDGVVAELEERRLGFPVGTDESEVVPVVPGAVIFDLGRGGRFGNRPGAEMGRRAARTALSGRSAPSWGSFGAGTGARSGGLQGGVGTASTTVDLAQLPPSPLDPGGGDEQDGAATATSVVVTVGAVAVVNSLGSPIDPITGTPWEPSGLAVPTLGRRRVAAIESARSPEPADGPALNTTIGVVGVSVALDKSEATRVASVAHDGLARAIRPAHGMADGDTVFTLATRHDSLSSDPTRRRFELDLVMQAAADVFAAACTHAIVTARSHGDPPSWRDLAFD